LLKEMREQRPIEPDTLKLGILVYSQSRVSGVKRKSTADLFVVGALSTGQLWEITAVPDIHVQARTAAETVPSRMAGRSA
jgi:uncharacterized NAD(P)/FAD-binding protein YdhS